MNKVCGNKDDFAFFREDASRIIIGYECKKVEGEDLYEWYEIYIPKKQKGSISFQEVKDAIINDINAQTDMKIVSGLVWESADGEMIPVWLSTENQFNFKSAYDLAVQKNGATLPVTFKMGETEYGKPVYHTFSTMEESDDFYTKAVAFINQTLTEGWQRKDSIDWEPYRQVFDQLDTEEEVTE